MASFTRRLSSTLLAGAVICSMVAEPVLAQVSPGAPTVGPAGGTPSTTSPSNQDGTPAGGTGVVGTTRTQGMAPNDGRIVLNPQQSAEPAAPMRQTRRMRRQARRVRPAAARPTMRSSGEGSAQGLNGSNAQSTTPR